MEGVSVGLTEEQLKLIAILARMIKEVVPCMSDESCNDLFNDLVDHVKRTLSQRQKRIDYSSFSLQDLIEDQGAAEEEAPKQKKRGRQPALKIAISLSEDPHVSEFISYDAATKMVTFVAKRDIESPVEHTMNMRLEELQRTMLTATRSSFVQAVKIFYNHDLKKIPEDLKKI